MREAKLISDGVSKSCKGIVHQKSTKRFHHINLTHFDLY